MQMGNAIMIFLFFLSLSILIILHEIGHFLPAKWFKTRVEKFYLFFNPYFSIFKKKIGETEYGIGWLPLGGYVKIAGMVDESFDKEQLKREPQPWEFRTKPAWQRLIIMLGGVTVNFALGFFLFGMLLWIYGSEYIKPQELKFGVAVDSVAYEMGFRDGDVLLKVGGQPLEKFDRRSILKPLLLHNARQIEVLRDGMVKTIDIEQKYIDFLVRPEAQSYSLWTERIPAVIGILEPGFPAEKAGLKVDDEIISLNEQPVPYYNDFVKMMKGRASEKILVGVRRGADTLAFSITTTEKGKIGIGPKPLDTYFKTEKNNYSLFEAMGAGTMQGVKLIKDYCTSIGQLFGGHIKAKDSLGGFISITKQFPNTFNWPAFWSITAMLSIILGFMNLLPIPALDGGYVMFLILEVITGKKIEDRIVEKATMFGFLLLIGLLIYANGLDIFRLFK